MPSSTGMYLWLRWPISTALACLFSVTLPAEAQPREQNMYDFNDVVEGNSELQYGQIFVMG